MPQDTPNHGYNRPDKGAEDWDTPINTNFENLDTDIEVRDSGTPGSNGYDPVSGAKYLDTDTGVVYEGDGSSWTPAFAIARFTPQGSGGAGSIALGDTSNTVGSNAGNVVTGGQNNDADGPYAAVGGGDGNTATGQESAIPGGLDNTASGTRSAVSGGSGNEATANEATVGGGENNAASASDATVAGGQGNTASANSATAGGGFNNLADAEYATIAGGGSTDTQNADSTRNAVYDNYGTIAGGGNNTAGTDDGTKNAVFATVGGGRLNEATGKDATVGGGNTNTASSNNAVVAGGNLNDATAQSAAVAGGANNKATSGSAAIGGGANNNATAISATVGGGNGNEASGESATVPGGDGNTASGNYSAAMGRNATADNDGALVVGDSTSNAVSSDAADQAVFQQSVLTRGSFETAASYNFANTAMFTTSSVNNNDNDQWSVAIPDLYGAAIPQFTVENTGEVTVRGDLQVDGNLNRNLGVEVTRLNDQSIPDGSETRVEFNDVQRDDNNEWENNNYQFVADSDGTYRLDLGIRFTESMAAGTTYTVYVYSDGTFEARSTNSTPPQGGAVSEVSVQFTKTIWSLSANDSIYVTVELSGDSNTIAVDYDETWLDIVRVGP